MMLVLGAWLLGCTPVASAAVGDDLFARYEIETGFTGRPSVLTGHLLDGEVAELALVHVDGSEGRFVRIYAFEDGSWAPYLDARLGHDVMFADVVRIGGRDRLVTYEPGRLNWFDPDSKTERPLVAVRSSFSPPRRDEVPQVDIARDVNGDGRDDLLVPDVDGFWVFVQTEGGAFADPLKVGPRTDLSRIMGPDGYRYDPWGQARVHGIDYDHDERVDLVFWSGEHFEVHTQDERGLFAPLARTFTTEVAFDSDDPSFLATGDMSGRVLHSLADLNGDGVGDLVLHALEGRRVSRMRSAYEVHFGSRTPAGGTAFDSALGLTFQTPGSLQLGMERHDFDGDGQLDVMVTTIRLEFLEGSLWKSFKGFMGGDIGMELEFYRNDGGRYADRPDAIRGVGLLGSPGHRSPGAVDPAMVLRGATHERRRTRNSCPRAFNVNCLEGDVTGDGRTDLLIEGSFRGLDLFVGVPGPGLFAPRPQNVAVIVPNDEEYSRLVDLNQDGKQDILLHHPFILRDIHGGPRRPAGSEPHRLTLLIAR